MTRSQRDRAEQEAQFNETNPVVRFRPSVDKLTQKLRDMTMMQDRNVRVHITEDQIWMLRHDSVALSRIIKQAMGWWEIASGLNEHSPEYKNLVFSKTGNPVNFDLNEDAVRKSEIDLDSKELKKSVRIKLSEHTFEWEYPQEQYGHSISCSCGREFDFTEEWANHVRSVIWRVLSESTNFTRDSVNTEQTSDQTDQAD